MGRHDCCEHSGIERAHQLQMNDEVCAMRTVSGEDEQQATIMNADAFHRHRPRRKRLRKTTRITIPLLSCMVATALANTEPTPIEECKEPAINLNFFQRKLKQLPVSSAPSDSPQLGDGMRSAEASGIFFDSLDTDGDGAIEPEEVATFLQNEIGGKQFDTQSEVDEEVGTIMQSLDQNHNNGLEMSDMLNYWLQLESLLTAEEVSEWIVYSVQLPSSIGKIFLENGITGYDFLEIVDNGGEVLQHELGIDKSSFRNKIVRQMQSRMLGIGSSPEAPQEFTFKLESCKAVTLSWQRSMARVFPVHSYRVQRRAINLFGSQSSNDSTLTAENSNNFDSSLITNSGWKTVYVGVDQEFVDSSLENGHNYMYRIQAWNSVGRSGWESLDLTKALKKQRCSTKSSQPVLSTDRGIPTNLEATTQWEWMSTPSKVMWGFWSLVQFMYHSVRSIFAFFALFSAVMRVRRATATSSASANTMLPFPWFWNGINQLSMKLVGQECIPRTMLGDREALIRQEQLHDERIMATGLRGYDRIRKKAESDVVEKDDKLGDLHVMDRRKTLQKSRSQSTGDLTSMSTVTFGPPEEVMIPNGKTKAKRFAWKSPKPNGLKHHTTTSSFGPSVSEDSDSTSYDLRSRGFSTMSKSDHPTSRDRKKQPYVDDGSSCSECHKKFRIGKRYKHHCSRCMATFCHKHGRTTHNNFTSCRVPGDCMCNTCLKVMSSRSESSERSRQKRSSAISCQTR